MSTEIAGSRPIRRTTIFRLAFVFSLLFAAGIIVFGGLIYAMTSRELKARTDEILEQKAALLIAAPANDLPRRVRFENAQNVHGLNFIALFSASGERIEGDFGPLTGMKLDVPVDIDRGVRHRPMRVIAVATRSDEIILVARDISEIRYLLRRMIVIMLASSIAVIPAALIIGRLLSHGPRRRVQQLEEASREIAAGRFDLRIPITERADEFDQIAATINTMVEDIGRVIAQVKNVTDSIAHDLRTPLTRVRNRLDEARQAGARLGGEDMVGDLIGDLDVVLERFAALLRIAELEASERRSGFGSINVDALFDMIGELYGPLAEDADIHLECIGDATVQLQGDASLLLEALGNLVDNAIKFAKTSVRVSALSEDGATIIAIQDDGPGIAETEREAVLQRFYRTANDADRPGFGLGLSIVTAILHIHHYSLHLEDAEPGLRARIVAPQP